MGDETPAANLTPSVRTSHFILRSATAEREAKEPMSTELAMNAYVLLGNTLRHLLSRAPAAMEEQLGVPPGALTALNQRIEPLTPACILTGIAGLTTPERDLLASSVRLCLSTLSPEGVANVLGLPVDVAHETIAALRLDEPKGPIQA